MTFLSAQLGGTITPEHINQFIDLFTDGGVPGGISGIVTLTGTVTAAQIQAAVDARLGVILPAGTHSISTTITLPVGASIRGMGAGTTLLDWTGGNTGVMFSCLKNSLTATHITISDMTIQCNSTNATGLTGISLRYTSADRFENLIFQGVQTPFHVDRGLGISIRGIKLGSATLNPPGGCWFGSTSQTEYLGSVSISDFHHYFGDPAVDAFTDAAAVITFNRCVATSLDNFQFHFQPPSTKVGIRLENDCQGVNINNGLMVGMDYGVVLDEDPNFPVSSFPLRAPSFTIINGVAFDGASTLCIRLLHGSDNKIIGCDLTNSAAGLVVGAGAPRIAFNMNNMNNITNNGIVLGAGALSYQMIGNRIALGAGSLGVVFAISAGVSTGILLALNDFKDSNPNGTIFDASTSGADRYYIDNLGAAPVISTPTGAVVRISNGFVGIGDSTNAKMTLGLTVNQGAADDEILALKSSDVAHGITNVTETDTYGAFQKDSAANGGLRITGLEDTATVGLKLVSYATTADGTYSTAGLAHVIVDAVLKNGVAGQSIGADKSIIAFRDNGTARFFLDSDGDSHQDVGTAWTNYHGHDDIALITAVAANVTRLDDPIRRDFGGFLFEKREELERLRLVDFNDDGHHFVNMSKLTMLLVGAVQQIASGTDQRFSDMEHRLAAIEAPQGKKN